MDNFGKRLRKAREDKNLTQSDLAKKLGYKQNSPLSAIESGKTSPSLETLQKIADTINIDLHWLITGRQTDFKRALEVLITQHEAFYSETSKKYQEVCNQSASLEMRKDALNEEEIKRLAQCKKMEGILKDRLITLIGFQGLTRANLEGLLKNIKRETDIQYADMVP